MHGVLPAHQVLYRPVLLTRTLRPPLYQNTLKEVDMRHVQVGNPPFGSRALPHSTGRRP
jgi:hypothetical protein